MLDRNVSSDDIACMNTTKTIVYHVHWIEPSSRENRSCDGRPANAFATRDRTLVTCSRCQNNIIRQNKEIDVVASWFEDESKD